MKCDIFSDVNFLEPVTVHINIYNSLNYSDCIQIANILRPYKILNTCGGLKLCSTGLISDWSVQIQAKS